MAAEKEIVRRFEAKFSEPYHFVVKVPGRVNLIGEHIDYCGYSVLPMALEKAVLIAVGARDDAKIVMANVDDAYDDFDTKIDEIKIVKGEPHWHSYFLCGVQGVIDTAQNSFSEKSKKQRIEWRGMNCLVHGSVPPSAGLSSSSALVCAAAIAFAHSNAAATSNILSLSDHRAALADACARSERHIGTEGGGMDQAIALLATEGRAKLIDFNPLVAHDVELPAEATFVVANSLVKANKAASSSFNCRVVECRLAAKAIAATHGLDPALVLKLVDVQTALNQTLEEVIATTKVTLHEASYSKDEVASLLRLSVEQLEACVLTENTRHLTEFRLRQRALHVFEEALRVRQFQGICTNKDHPGAGGDDRLTKLGHLMNQSHASCRDLYECSHPQLDCLVALATTGPGCFGARLTGAGWGGCMVALVKGDQSDSFLSHLVQNYYSDRALFPTPLSPDELHAAVFVTRAGAGASILTPP